MALSEIKPICRLSLFKTGYELGGYNKYSNIYGYKFKYDPNVLRISASAMYAALKGYFEIVQFLLESGSDQDFQDELGCTPLHLAAK